jgi:DNA helicase HerA-like ATPase
MACHTAILAQSGSGKSFFLGRLLEEIVLETKARLLILDPNADFRAFDLTQSPSLWTTARYDRHEARGLLPHEKNARDFRRRWPSSEISVRTMKASQKRPVLKPMKLPWASLTMDVLAEDLEPASRSDLYNCHRFVRRLAELRELNPRSAPGASEGVISDAAKLLQAARKLGATGLRADLETRYARGHASRAARYRGLPAEAREFVDVKGSERLKLLIDALVELPNYISEMVEHFYFSRARALQAEGIVSEERQSLKTKRSARIDVIDLPSLRDTNARLLVLMAVMREEWAGARRRWEEALQNPPPDDMRVPTFIVVDEAHNLIPKEPRSRAEELLREQFRTVVAEGRKFGLFLVLVSQRPDKLDPLVLGECGNIALMRLSSRGVVRDAKQLLGLEDVSDRVLEKCLEMGIGRALLVGNWADDGPTWLYSAARRTVEGGRNLRDDFWATPVAT